MGPATPIPLKKKEQHVQKLTQENSRMWMRGPKLSRKLDPFHLDKNLQHEVKDRSGNLLPVAPCGPSMKGKEIYIYNSQHLS